MKASLETIIGRFIVPILLLVQLVDENLINALSRLVPALRYSS